MTIDDGGPAFSFPGISTDGTDIPWLIEPFPGMSLRDWFAGMALSSVMREPRTRQWLPSALAGEAYAVADAMLVARKREEADDDD